MTVPPPTSIFTWAVVAPRVTLTTRPFMTFRALSFITSPSAAARGPCPRVDRNLLRVRTLALEGPKVPMQVRLPGSEDATISARVEAEHAARKAVVHRAPAGGGWNPNRASVA